MDSDSDAGFHFVFFKVPETGAKPTLMSYLGDDLSHYCVGVCTS